MALRLDMPTNAGAPDCNGLDAWGDSGVRVAALQLSLELATRTPGLGWGESLPSDVGECMQREVQALAGLKRRLRDDDARSMVVREHVADALTAFSATIGFCRRSFGARNCGRARSPNVPGGALRSGSGS